MQDSYPFNVYSGILQPQHRKRIGSALWEFLWCIDKTTREIPDTYGEQLGLVLGGKPINLSEISRDLGIDKSTVLRNLGKLEDEGYLIIVRAPYGLILKVKNSKKRLIARTQQEPNIIHKTVAKTQQPLQERNGRCENANSNKDLSLDLSFDLKEKAVVVVDEQPPNQDEGIPSPQQGTVPAAAPQTDTDSSKVSPDAYRQAIISKYLQRRAKGFDITPKDEESLTKIMQARIPLRTALEGIDLAFNEYKPAHDFDEIRSLNYCLPHIFDLNAKNGSRLKQAANGAIESLPAPEAQPRTLRRSSRGPAKPDIPIAHKKAERKQLSDEEMEAIIKKASRWEEMTHAE